MYPRPPLTVKFKATFIMILLVKVWRPRVAYLDVPLVKSQGSFNSADAGGGLLITLC